MATAKNHKAAGTKTAPATTSAKTGTTRARKAATTATPKKAAAPAAKKVAAKKTAPKKVAAPAAKKVAAKKTAAKKAPATKARSSARGVVASKDFDEKFLETQLQSLVEERESLTGQAHRLEAEANSLIEDVEMGDVQFDDESGEGDTMVVERERDLALSAQARQVVAEIDQAIARIHDGTYGYSALSGLPIPKERLRAIPWATLRVDEKAGGIGRR